jgi:hypothetical protein
MTPIASPRAFHLPSVPVDPRLLACRERLLADPEFAAGFQALDRPAALLNTCHQVVLANDRLCRWLEMDSDRDLVGAVPGDLTPCPGCPDLLVRTRFQEHQGQGFILLTIDCMPAPT